MIERALQLARLEFHERAEATIGSDAFLAYVRSHGLDIMAIGWHAGVTALLISEHPDSRFEFADQGSPAFVFEALCADGETIVDLVAWRLDTPERPVTM